MATIITVHGTNATGPEEGDNWWQKGSEFERDIRELVESEDGQLKFEPHVWDGANSESSRRKAGEGLFRKILGLEDSHEAYCLVGHSHGGSVISNTLLKASAKKNPLEYLKKWITIGTPFILTKKNLLLFSRLSFIGKAIYISLITFITISIAGAIGVFLRRTSISGAPGSGVVDEVTVPMALFAFMLFTLFFSIPFILFYVFMLFMNSRSLYTHRKKNVKYSDKHFSGRWFSLWHKKDEAIQGLRSIKSLNFNIFAADFSVPALSFFSVFIFPLIFLYMISSQAFMMWFFGFLKEIDYMPILKGMTTGEGNLIGDGQDMLINAAFLFRSSFRFVFDISTPVVGGFNLLVQMALLVFTIPLFFLALSLFLMFLVKIVAMGLSRILSGILNGLTWSQIRKSAFGDDAAGDRSLDARDFPMWMSKPSPPLPDPLGNEILSFSNQEAAKSLPKFRDAINQLAFSESEGSKSDVISEYLTWNELIHTAYLSLPRFRKLVAYAIAQSGGFRATSQFKNDPDYELVAKWYDEIQANEEPALQGDG